MTAEERVDRWWSRLRPKLLELAEEGHEITFYARDESHPDDDCSELCFEVWVDNVGWPENDEPGVAFADPDEALEGFLE